MQPFVAVVKHVLIAVDGSRASRECARFALELARPLGARATLLTVLPQGELIPLGPLGTSIAAPTPTETDLNAMRAQLDAIAREHPEVKIDRVVEVGRVAETIVDWAAKNAVDLIVLGARGLGPTGRFLLGSVSDRVMHHAHCPVTVWR